MNYIKASISEIRSCENINIVSFKVGAEVLHMMSLELSESLQVGTEVSIGTKSTNISLAKDFRGDLSVSNQLPCTLVSLEYGELLCRVKLDFLGHEIESIITKESALKMNLQVEDKLIALIKSSELSIVEVL